MWSLNARFSVLFIHILRRQSVPRRYSHGLPHHLESISEATKIPLGCIFLTGEDKIPTILVQLPGTVKLSYIHWSARQEHTDDQLLKDR